MLKVCEAYTQPCHLDSAADVIKILKKGDVMVKLDDKQGFHHILLDSFSRNLAFCDLKRNRFRYKGSAFGLPSIPGFYQLINGCAINYLCMIGIRAYIYLDDRIIIFRPESAEQAKYFMSGKKMPKDLIITMLLLTAL